MDVISFLSFFKRVRVEFKEAKTVLWSLSFEEEYTPEGIKPKDRTGFLSKEEFELLLGTPRLNTPP